MAWSTPPAPYDAKRDHLPHVSNAAGALIRHARSVFKVKEELNRAGRGHGAAHCGEGGASAACQQYGGHYFDSDTALSYLGARYLNSNVGRFVSEDLSFLSIGDF